MLDAALGDLLLTGPLKLVHKVSNILARNAGSNTFICRQLQPSTFIRWYRSLDAACLPSYLERGLPALGRRRLKVDGIFISLLDFIIIRLQQHSVPSLWVGSPKGNDGFRIPHFGMDQNRKQQFSTNTVTRLVLPISKTFHLVGQTFSFRLFSPSLLNLKVLLIQLIASSHEHVLQSIHTWRFTSRHTCAMHSLFC